ncbi:WecB/TagA/CpsF family glycosyltransferase [Synechocystis sp. LKSZ1]|uniref:WecB/TagA/CpsF family glycosyltransferase n=1 Tax=Synechocystis sp. LKSZ1 TaxID=3144951 RepID=UPI00336C18EC
MPTSRVILKTRIDGTSYEMACQQILDWICTSQASYVVAANVHVVMTAYWQPTYQQVINEANLVTPDGMPLVWGLRLLGLHQQDRVYGPDLMLALCRQAAQQNIPIYLYGGTDKTLEKLQDYLRQLLPGLDITGAYSPPFRPLTFAEEAKDIERIRQAGAKLIFVGLGCPKQEIWMARHYRQLTAVMIGVGAAFNFHSGEVAQAPRWLMPLGLEWAYRLIREPRRLWRRYLFNNPIFVILFVLQLVHHLLSQMLAGSNPPRA